MTEAVRNTQQSSDNVERIKRIAADELACFYGPLNVNTVDEIAEAVTERILEVSHHAQLVALLRHARPYVHEAWEVQPNIDANVLLAGIDSLLAKIGGDPGPSSTPRDERE